ncbi:tRNA isopentenyltransferase [Cladochytrium replicatum]|nr:tRNA isopentenyltransferase [Cladochytrium replicatum]
MTPRIVLVLGTTGVGKSKLAIRLAQALNGEIINADAMQVYRGFDVVTNKVTLAERMGIPHHLMDFVDPKGEYSVRQFLSDATNVIDEIHGRNKLAILVGGTHYYLQSLIWDGTLVHTLPNISREGSNEFDSEEPLRRRVIAVLDSNTDSESANSALYELLKEVDPVMAERWHPNDFRKIRKSLQLYADTGKRNSDLLANQTKTLRYPTCLLWLYADWPILDDRLDARVDEMIERGMFDEIRASKTLFPAQDPDYTRGVHQIIGFKEFHDYLQKEKSIAPNDHPHSDELHVLREEGLTRMKIGTRQYARRQVRWIKNKLFKDLGSVKKDEPSGNTVTFHVLDTTELEKWDEVVEQPAISAVAAFMKNEPLESTAPAPTPVLESLLLSAHPPSEIAEAQPKKPPVDRTLYICPVCVEPDSTPKKVHGEGNWKAHLTSKMHRRALRRAGANAEGSDGEN